jgi:hypothetical protein
MNLSRNLLQLAPYVFRVQRRYSEPEHQQHPTRFHGVTLNIVIWTTWAVKIINFRNVFNIYTCTDTFEYLNMHPPTHTPTHTHTQMSIYLHRCFNFYTVWPTNKQTIKHTNNQLTVNVTQQLKISVTSTSPYSSSSNPKTFRCNSQLTQQNP